MIVKFPSSIIGKGAQYEVDFIMNNLEDLKAESMGTVKLADACCIVNAGKSVLSEKAEGDDAGASPLKARLIINTTYVMVSHRDVHINGIWDDDLKNAEKIRPLLQEHKNQFSHVIDDVAKAGVHTYDWTQLGLKAIGKTQALTLDANITELQNAFMHNRYKNGFVKNHSVGMMYESLVVAINDEENYPDQFKNWKKYYPKIVNGSEADKIGYFFAILQARMIEGSAVPMGSNKITPVYSLQEAKGDSSLIGDGACYDEETMKALY